MQIQVNQEQLDLINKWGESIVELSKQGFLDSFKYPISKSEALLSKLQKKQKYNLIKNKDHPMGDVLDNEDKTVSRR
jgi:hypothetical protein